METQNQDAARSPSEATNDPGKMFVGGLSWQTSPGKSPLSLEEETRRYEYVVVERRTAI